MDSIQQVINRAIRYGANAQRLIQGQRYANGLGDPGLPVEPPSVGPLRQYFDDLQAGPGIHKWLHYFEIYERHLGRFVGTDAHMVEVGIFGGGSLPMWGSYLGDRATIHGVDIDERCRKYASDRVTVSIGDQADRTFWREFVAEHPRIDIVVDDGGHEAHQQIPTLEELLPHIAPGGVYICEDIHFAPHPFHAYVDGLGRPMHQISPVGGAARGVHQQIASIHRYPLVTVIEKPMYKVPVFESHRHGSEWPP